MHQTLLPKSSGEVCALASSPAARQRNAHLHPHRLTPHPDGSGSPGARRSGRSGPHTSAASRSRTCSPGRISWLRSRTAAGVSPQFAPLPLFKRAVECDQGLESVAALSGKSPRSSLQYRRASRHLLALGFATLGRRFHPRWRGCGVAGRSARSRTTVSPSGILAGRSAIRTLGSPQRGNTASNSLGYNSRSSYKLAMGWTVIPSTNPDHRNRRTGTYESGVRLHRERRQSNSSEQRRCKRRDSGCPAHVREGVRVPCIGRRAAGSISPGTPGGIERRCGRSLVFPGRETGLRDPSPISRISNQPAIDKAPSPGDHC